MDNSQGTMKNIQSGQTLKQPDLLFSQSAFMTFCEPALHRNPNRWSKARNDLCIASTRTRPPPAIVSETVNVHRITCSYLGFFKLTFIYDHFPVQGCVFITTAIICHKRFTNIIYQVTSSIPSRYAFIRLIQMYSRDFITYMYYSGSCQVNIPTMCQLPLSALVATTALRPILTMTVNKPYQQFSCRSVYMASYMVIRLSSSSVNTSGLAFYITM